MEVCSRGVARRRGENPRSVFQKGCGFADFCAGVVDAATERVYSERILTSTVGRERGYERSRGHF
jgi:hypothetical protein